jgi:hypothetical protein
MNFSRISHLFLPFHKSARLTSPLLFLFTFNVLSTRVALHYTALVFDSLFDWVGLLLYLRALGILTNAHKAN